MKSKPIENFQLLEKELITEQRFGLIAMLCNRILKIQSKYKRLLSVTLDVKKTKKGMISFNVWEIDSIIGINKKTLELRVIHLNKNNNPDGFVINNKIVNSNVNSHRTSSKN